MEDLTGMNYFLNVVINGYFDANTKQFLSKYFLRSFKKSAVDHYYEAEEFYSGCNRVLDAWEAYLKTQINERKKELQIMFEMAEDKTLTYSDLEGKTIQEKWQETIEYCKSELSNEGPNWIGSLTFNVHLGQVTNGRIYGSLHYNEIQHIREELSIAFTKSQPNPKSKKHSKLPITDLWNEFENEHEINEITKALYDNELISEDRSTWIGTKMNGKSQLASVIKFIGLKYLQKTFSVKDVQSIALNTFNIKISIATIKTSPPSNGEYYFLNNQ